MYAQQSQPNQPIEPSPPHREPGKLLAQRGWFLLPEVFRVLAPGDPARYKLVFKQVARISERGEDPFEVLGYLKSGSRVMILMERFAPWYLANPLFQLERVLPETLEAFLARDHGFFRLSEICNNFPLPFTYNIIKRMADRSENAIEEFGVQKFDKNYLVKLPEFANWLREQL